MSEVPERARYDLANACSFRFAHYREMLERARAEGYALVAFRDHDPSRRRIVILRHDLDTRIAVERAIRFAEIEAELGATATYFVRVHAPDYNPFDYRTYTAIRRILAMGHEIGLHHEVVDMSAVTGEDPVVLFRREKAMLETVVDGSVTATSQHGDYSAYSNPDYHQFFDRHSKQELGIHTVSSEPQFAEAMKYLSDSNGIWPEGCFCQHIGQRDRYQVLTHPDQWFDEHYHTR